MARDATKAGTEGKTARRRLLDPFLIRGRITSVESLGPRMRRISLAGPAIRGLKWTPGQQVRVIVSGSAAALDWVMGTLRTYSVWDYDGETLELVAFLHTGNGDHGEGPGAAWARAVAVGDEVVLMKPQGDFTLRPITLGASAFHLFVGEETASVALGAMLRAVPAGERAVAVLEVQEAADQLPLTGDVHWHHRGAASAADSQSLVAAVRAALSSESTLPTDTPSGGPGIAYLAGEARTIQAVRTYLVKERGWSRRSVLTKPFWTPGKTGME
jgi:NADPH-dependent ferric siderophore reductase